MKTKIKIRQQKKKFQVKVWQKTQTFKAELLVYRDFAFSV